MLPSSVAPLESDVEEGEEEEEMDYEYVDDSGVIANTRSSYLHT